MNDDQGRSLKFSDMRITIEAEVSPETIADDGRAGSATVFVGKAVYQRCGQKMADIITRARALQ